MNTRKCTSKIAWIQPSDRQHFRSAFVPVDALALGGSDVRRVGMRKCAVQTVPKKQRKRQRAKTAN